MNSIWQSLIWKEWHEHKWKLAAVLAVLVGATSVAMLQPGDDKFQAAFGMLCVCVIPLAIFVGLGIAANERARGTLPFLQAQPIYLWRAGLVKLITSLLTLMIPIAATALWLFVLRYLFDSLGVVYRKRGLESDSWIRLTDNPFVAIAIFGSLIAVSLIIWAAAIGVNRKDEVSAGAFAIAITILWSTFVWVMAWSLGPRRFGGPEDWTAILAMSMLPCGFAAIADPVVPQPLMAFGLGMSGIVHALLAAFYVLRFGQLMQRPVTSPKPAERQSLRCDWLGSPRQSVFTATVWKQVRESLPLALVGLAAIVGVAAVTYVFQHHNNRFTDVYLDVSYPLACCIALVVGIGVALNDVGPQLNTFWRSRPIDASLWFWTKFITGLLVLLAVWI